MTRKMFALAAFGTAFVAAATPAAAQWNGSVVDTQSLRARIDDGVARGGINAGEAASLRSQLRGLINLQRQYQEDGLSAGEREDLRQRAQGLRNEIANAEGETASYGRYGNAPGDQRYGNGQRYGDQGAYGNRYGGGYDRSGNAPYGSPPYGSGQYGNGRYGNGAYGGYGNGAYPNRYGSGQYDRDDDYSDDSDRGGRRYDRDQRYDRDDGYDEQGYELRVGDRVPGGLEAVPNGYRARFRDGGGVYYRYGDGNVYQIDSRTGVVLRIYSIDR